MAVGGGQPGLREFDRSGAKQVPQDLIGAFGLHDALPGAEQLVNRSKGATDQEHGGEDRTRGDLVVDCKDRSEPKRQGL